MKFEYIQRVKRERGTKIQKKLDKVMKATRKNRLLHIKMKGINKIVTEKKERKSFILEKVN